MSHESFPQFHAQFLRRIETRVHSAGVSREDAEDVVQEIWLGFWRWLSERKHQDALDHVGMLMEFTDWRIASYFKAHRRLPATMEIPEAIAVADHSGIGNIRHEQETAKLPFLLRNLAKRAGGNVLRLLDAAAKSRGHAGALHHDFIRSYMEHTMQGCERRAVRAELLAQLPSRQSLDSGIERLRRSWNRLAPAMGISPLIRARASPIRRRARGQLEFEYLLHDPKRLAGESLPALFVLLASPKKPWMSQIYNLVIAPASLTRPPHCIRCGLPWARPVGTRMELRVDRQSPL